MTLYTMRDGGPVDTPATLSTTGTITNRQVSGPGSPSPFSTPSPTLEEESSYEACICSHKARQPPSPGAYKLSALQH